MRPSPGVDDDLGKGEFMGPAFCWILDLASACVTSLRLVQNQASETPVAFVSPDGVVLCMKRAKRSLTHSYPAAGGKGKGGESWMMLHRMARLFSETGRRCQEEP